MKTQFRAKPARSHSLPEILEARIAPAAVFWDGGGDGMNWTSPNNWSNNAVPTDVDDVTINPGGTVTITLSSGAQTVASLSMPGDDALAISGGSLALAGASVIHNLALGGSGSLFANGALSLTGAGSFSGAAILGGSSVVTNNGTLGITSGDPDLQTELVNANAGTIQHGNAFLDLNGAAAKLRVVSGGLYDIVVSGNGFSFRALNGTPGVLIEAGGLLRQSTPNGASFDVGSGVPFSVNGGTLETTGAGSSPLNLNGVGVFTNANLVPSLGKTINFSGDNTVVGTITGSGAGVVNLASGQLHATAAGATLNFPAGLFNWSGSGSLSGPGVFTNTGTIQITSGEPDLATELVNPATIKHGNAILDLDGAAAKLRVVPGGLYDIVVSGNGFSFRALNGTPGVIIETGGLLKQSTLNGAFFNIGSGVPLTVNGGTLESAGGGGSPLNLNGIGVFTNATLVAGANATINFGGDDNTIIGTLTGSGAGVVNLASGQLHATAAGATLNFPAGLFNWSGSGSLSGPGVFTNTGTIQITSGEPDLATELVNPATIKHGNAILDLDGAAAKLRVVPGGLYDIVVSGNGFSFRALNGTPGVIIETGGLLRQSTPNGAFFNIGEGVPFAVNGGTLESAGGGSSPLNLNGIGVFTNAILVAGANASINFSGNDNTVVGTITGSGAGVVNLASGQLHATAAGATLNFPAGLFNWSGSGTLSGPGVFTNTGTIQITSGEPDLATELVNPATIKHGNAILDLDGAAAKLRVVPGGLYDIVVSGNGFSFRALDGTPGVVIETGGLLRQSTPNGAFFNIGEGVPFAVNGGTLESAGGGSSPLNLNGIGVFTNAILVAGANASINFSGNDNTVVGTITGSGAGVVNLASGQLHATAAGAVLNFPAGLFNWSGSGTLSGPGVFTNTGTIQITSGEPDLATELVNPATIKHGNAILDLDGAAAKLRTIAGGVYETVTTGNGFSFRVSGGSAGMFVEAGAIFRHNTPNGAFFNIGSGVPFTVNGGTLESAGGGSSPLILNGTGVFTNAILVAGTNATINFSGNDNTVVGTITGSGAGVVNLASGQLHATAAGASLNFPAGLFSLSGTGSLSGPGVFTNKGTIQITGGEPDLATELVNAGTIKHGNAFLDLDGAAVKLRTIGGGLYETVTTGNGFSFRVVNDSPGVFIEAGATFRHNAPSGAFFDTGTTTPFSNLGTVEVARGSLNFTGPLAQRGGTTGAATLTGGAWEVANGATLNLGITGLASNAASITVHGTGSFTGLSALATNSGSLALLGGADLTKTTGLTNSGALTLSSGSVLTAPSFTQSATGSVAFEIGGTAATQLGRIATAGAATLAGTASVSVTGGFDPQAGQNFALMSFASRTGAFASVVGLNVGHAPLFEAIHSATNFSLNSLVNASDLAVETVTTPGPVAAGNDVSFSYTVRNTGAFVTPVATWSDTIYLSRDGVVDSSDIVLTRITHNGAVAANGTYTNSVTVPLVGALPADYQIIVAADTLGRVADTDRGDNTLASTGAFTLSIPTLTAGVAFNGTIVSGRDQFFQITLPAGQAPTFTFTGAVTGQAEIYESIGAVPTRANFFESAFVANSTVQRIVGETTAAATYFILVHGRENAGAGQTFSLVADGVGFDLNSTTIAGGPNIGKVTTTLSGTQFSPATTFTLVSGGTTRPATATYFRDGRNVDATFDLTGLAAGSYDIVANNGGPTDTLTNAFAVTAGGTVGTLQYSLSVPRYIRPPFNGTVVTLTYANVGGTDIDAPLFNLLAENARLRLADQPGYVAGAFTQADGRALGVFELLGVSGGLAGVLSPGERATIEVIFEPINSATRAMSNFDVFVADYDPEPLDLTPLKEAFKPVQIANDAWDAVFANFQAGAGTTVGSYKAMLVDNANYLGQFGPLSPDVTRLVSFELDQADNFGAISQRYESSVLGRGNVGPFSLQLEADSLGNITLSEGVGARFFTKLANGTYRSAGDDTGVLTRDGAGIFTLKEVDGSKTVFRPDDGHINYVEDSAGHRVTGTWNAGGQLVRLTNNVTDDATDFTYNAQGHIATATDAVGRVTNYVYDASGEHLTSLTTPLGTTNYTYVTGEGAAREHAIASITTPGGVTTGFTYDALGRLTGRTTGTGAESVALSYTHTGPGVLTVSDAGAHSQDVFFGPGGAILRSVDPLGMTTSTSFDVQGRLIGTTDANGVVSKITYGANGTAQTLANPDRTRLVFDVAGDPQRIVSVTDPRGGLTTFDHDARGNLLATHLPDGSGDRYEYDADGLVTAFTDANGSRSVFTRNAAGLVTHRELADGSDVDFTYDAHRNLLTATDSEGTTTFTYDGADRVTSVAYPNGKTVSTTYDSAGRRATVTDQSGYMVKYSYDALGRIDKLRDATDTVLVDYDYNSLGQIASETRGNGSSTTYTHDAAGRTANIVHRDAGNVVIEQFSYTYDANSRVKTQTDTSGTTTYSYDLNGQLTGVALPGGRTIAYAYDAGGNRTIVTDSASGAENYTTNNGDGYTAAGGEMLAYDGAGRLIARTAGGVTTTYSYDANGQLTGVISPGSVITYDYDALGNRIGKVENGVRTDFAIDTAGLGVVFGEYTGATCINYATGYGVEARATGGSTAYYHFDGGGNTAALSGTSGASLATYKYLPFGEIAAQTGSVAQPFTFDGQLGVQDDAGDLFQMRARTYDASLGRFTTRDPLGFSGGSTNLYRFAGNDPANRSDPAGLDDYFLGANGDLIDGLGFTGGVGVFTNGEDIWDTGLYVTGGYGTGFSNGVSGTIGTSTDISGTSINITTSLVGAGATVTTDTDGNVIGASGSLEVGTASVAGGSVTVTGTQKISPRAVGELLGYPNPRKFRPDVVLGKDALNTLVQKSGSSTLFNDYLNDGLKRNLPLQDAILEAKAKVRHLENENFRNGGVPVPSGTRSGGSEVVRPSDPNNIVGPAGAGADPVPDIIAPGQARFDGFVSGTADFPYKIEFENKPSANAPAQVVRVTQTLDADLDLSTFAFTGFGFGANMVTASGTSFHTIFDATATLGVLVQIDADLNTITGLLDVTYTSLDPATNDVPFDPFAGFLPPNDATGKGDGFLTYSVQPKAGLANATNFTGIASIVFDTEDAIATPTVTNTLDIIVPDSAVTPFASATTSRLFFPVRWTGADDAGGSGLAGITLSFTDNDGPLQTATVANADGGFRFPGEIGHTYKFFSQAVDGVGNTEALAALPDATITVVAPTLISNKDGAKLRTFTDEDGDTYTIALAGPGTLDVVLLDPDNDGKGTIDQLFLTGSTVKSKVTVAVKRAKDGPDTDKLPDGDGIVTIGDLNVTGDLAAFAAKASDLTVDGVLATGAVGAVNVRDMISADVFAGTPGVTSIGTALTKAKFALSARNIGDGALINVGNPAAFIKAASIGDAFISAPSLGKLQTTAGAFDADLTIANAIGSITVKGGGISGQLTASTFGAVSITSGDFTGLLTSAATGLGKTPALASLTVSGGDIAGDITLLGSAGAITAKAAKDGTGGALSGDLTARSFGAIKTASDFTGTITSLATDLGKTAAIASLAITGGDLTGSIRLLGGIGGITVKAAPKGGPGGGILGGTIGAAKIGNLTTTGDLDDALILAGANLGDDLEPGGTGGAADTFAPGSIGKIGIGGEIIASVIAAGLTSTDDEFGNGDDTILGGTASAIAGITVKGSIDADSRFGAGLIKGTTKIATMKIDVATDPHFLIP